jgi:hypothetical protein
MITQADPPIVRDVADLTSIIREMLDPTPVIRDSTAQGG